MRCVLSNNRNEDSDSDEPLLPIIIHLNCLLNILLTSKPSYSMFSYSTNSYVASLRIAYSVQF